MRRSWVAIEWFVIACAFAAACKGSPGGEGPFAGSAAGSGSAAVTGPAAGADAAAGAESVAAAGADAEADAAAAAAAAKPTVGIDGATLVVTAADGKPFDVYAEPSVDGGYPPCFPGATARLVSGVQTCWRADGKEHGPQVALWGNGKRKSWSVYVDDVRRGPWVEWDEDGRMTYHAFTDAHGNWIGMTTRWRNGKKHGPETEYDLAGKPGKTTSWIDGAVVMTNEFTCPAGTTKKVAEGLTLTEDSMRENRTRITCERGGQPNGPYVDEFPGGTFEVVGTMVNGKRTGAETGYYDTGEKFWVGKRVNDKKAGTWTDWYPPGHKSTETDYDAKGQKVEEREYDDAGAVKGGTIYKNGDYASSWTGPKKK